MKKKATIGMLVAVAVISAAVVLWNGIGEGDWMGWWFPLFVFALIGVVLYFTGKQKVSAGANPNHHYPDICENCRPVQMHDGGPINIALWWYAAVNGLTREDAADRLSKMSVQDHAKVTDDHMRYLQRFPKP